MHVDDALIDRLAALSKLEFPEGEKSAIRNDLEKILSFMEKLNELNTDGVEPLVYVNEDEYNVFREDKIEHPISREEALLNAPLKDAEFIKVPKFVNK